MSVWYCTREDVKAALDSKETARNNAQIDRQCEAAAGTIESVMHRKFYPQIATRYFPWRDQAYPTPWRLWLDANELISITTMTSGGVTIPSPNYFLEPVNYGPPYSAVEINLANSSSFSSGTTRQRTIAITGVFGYNIDDVAAGTLAAAITTTSATTLTVTASSPPIGVGNLIKVDSERMVVTNKTMASTGQTLLVAMLDQLKVTTVAVTDGTQFTIDEVILINSERMLIVDIAGNNLTVKRAWDGTVLGYQASATTIYATRMLTVERGAAGTTAATHLISAPVTRHRVPGLIRQMAIAEAVTALLQEGTGYQRQGAGAPVLVSTGATLRINPGQGAYGPADLRAQAYSAYGRKARQRAV